MKPGTVLLLTLVVSCASYQPGADYRSLLTPFSQAPTGGELTARDFAVPRTFSAGLTADTGEPLTTRLEFLLTAMGDRVAFDGGAAPPFPLNAPTVWAAAQAGAKLNCLAASTLFASLAEGLGMPARVLWLYPRDLSDENHVVVLVWDEAGSHWLVVDPSYRTLFYGDGPLGPEELRSRVAAGLPVTLSAGASWNGDPVEADYLHYLTKNLYRWSTLGANGGRINLSPPDFSGFGPPWALATAAGTSGNFLAPP